MITSGQRNLKYLIFGLCAFILSTGPVCMAYLTASEVIGYGIVWFMIPTTLLTFAGVALTDKVYIPQLLERGKYALFITALLVTSFFINFAALLLEYGWRNLLGLPQPVPDPLDPWVLCYTFLASILMSILLAGFALWDLYEKYQRQRKLEEEYKASLEKSTGDLRDSIRIPEIKMMLNEAKDNIPAHPECANEGIRRLSAFLRDSLYSIRNSDPLPHLHIEDNSILSSSGYDFITKRRYRVHRHLALLTVFLLICLSMMFDSPDHPVLDIPNILATSSLFLTVAGLGYLNIYLIFPKFLRKGRERVYAMLLLAIIAVLLVALSGQAIIANGANNPQGIAIPVFVFPLVSAGYLLVFLFIIAGTASLVMIKENLMGQWRLSKLETETRRFEFEILQNQINPHFILNVLNNIGILSYESPEVAKRTLISLEQFLDYLLKDTQRGETSLAEEVTFFNNYLTMEKSTGRPLEYKIGCGSEPEGIIIPPLLLLPLVENAVKHSITSAGRRFINIDINLDGERLEFRCENSFNPGIPLSSEPGCPNAGSGGLGLKNTRRRLELLYAEDFKMNTIEKDNTFIAIISLPVKIK